MANKLEMPKRDVDAIQKGMKQYGVDSKGFLDIVNGWLEERKEDEGTEKYEHLKYFKECVETYISWGM